MKKIQSQIIHFLKKRMLLKNIIFILSLVAYDPTLYADTSQVDSSDTPLIYVPILVGDITIIIPVESSELPADPGENGKAGIAGIDSDNDGVRDDIERYIVYKYPNNPFTRRALYQYSQYKQLTLMNSNSQTIVRSYSASINKAISCLYKVRAYEGDAHTVLQDVEAIYLNTLERFRASLAANKHLNGEVGTLVAGTITTDCE